MPYILLTDEELDAVIDWGKEVKVEWGFNEVDQRIYDAILLAKEEGK